MVLPHYENSIGKRRKVPTLSRDVVLCCSLCTNVILLMTIIYLVTLMTMELETSDSTRGTEMVWHGGHPTDVHTGSCWCGAADKYCMCTPNLAIDLIIISGKQEEFTWLVRRKDTNQLATMGGFVEIDESAEHAVKRELKEETGVDLLEKPMLFGLYSDPRRDNRRRTVSAVYVVHLENDAAPRVGDDVKEVKRILMDDIEQHEYFADHKSILLDYRRFARDEEPETRTELDFAPDIVRSTCSHTTEGISLP